MSFTITPTCDLLLRGTETLPVGLYHLHLATASQLNRLHYSAGTLKTVQKRLKILTEQGFIQADSVPTRQYRSPYYYALDTKGIRYLKDIGMDVPESVRGASEVAQGYQFIDHSLELNDILISAIHIASVAPLYSLASFLHERALKRVPYKATWQGNTYSLVPDAFLDFRLQTTGGQRRLPVLLEHDRGTEEEKHFRRRIRAYVSFLQSGAYVQLFNTRAITVAFTTLTGARRIVQMRHWTQAELQEAGANNLDHIFLFADLSKPIEPRSVWLEKHWYTLQDSQPITLLQI